jgi:transposase InsO family protein
MANGCDSHNLFSTATIFTCCYKTDNGSTYTGHQFKQFCKEWNIVHVTGLPYNPQGQAIIEREYRTLKTQLLKNKKGGTP